MKISKFTVKENNISKVILKMMIVLTGMSVASRGLDQLAEARHRKTKVKAVVQAEPKVILIPDTYITVMNYNIKGLDGLFGGNKKKNLKRIMSEIANKFQTGTAPDVVLFQEVFSGDANKIVKSLNTPELYPYRAKGPAESGGHVYSSGLVTLSRYPILTNDLVEYTGQCSSWDCDANKGAQLVTIKADNWIEPVRILNTHMQATNEYDDIRNQQILRLKAFYTNFEMTKLNTIFAGDFNTKPNRPSYEFFKQNFKGFQNVGEFCSVNSVCQVHPNVNTELLYVGTKDHQFYSCSSNSSMVPVSFVRNFSNEVDGLELSDHKAYQVQYKIDWNIKGCK